MLLREHLKEYTREQLLNQARSFEFRKCSGLRKAALIDRIIECFCTQEMLIPLPQQYTQRGYVATQ